MAIKSEETEDHGSDSPSHDNEVVEVKADDDGDSDSDDDDAPPAATGAVATPAQIESAKQRKKDRWREKKEQTESARAEAAELRERLARQEERTNILLQQAEQRERQATPRVDPYEERSKQLLKEMSFVQREFESLPNDKQVAKREEYQTKYDDLRLKLFDVRADRAAAQRMRSVPQKNPIEQYIELNYSDVIQNERAMGRAKFYFNEAIADGRKDSKELLDECMGRVRSELQTQGPSPRPAPSASLRAKYSAPSQGARGGGAGGGKTNVEMNAHRKRLARAQFPDLDEDAAYQAWAKNHVQRQNGARQKD